MPDGSMHLGALVLHAPDGSVPDSLLSPHPADHERATRWLVEHGYRYVATEYEAVPRVAPAPDSVARQVMRFEVYRTP